MKSKKKQDKIDGQVSSWTQKLGVSIIGLLTALGAGLIIYTGVMATTYQSKTTDTEFLTMDEVNKDTSSDDQTTTEPTTEEKPATDSTTDEETNTETPVEEQKPVQTDDSKAYCNVDGVNIRSSAATGTEIVGNLDAGDEVQVLNRYYNDEWVQISFEGQTGYVYNDFLDFK